MTETQIKESVLFWSKTPTERLVRRGAPSLPDGFTYRLDINHPKVTARIGHLQGDEWVEVARFTEVTRADLGMACVAACKHAFEDWSF